MGNKIRNNGRKQFMPDVNIKIFIWSKLKGCGKTNHSAIYVTKWPLIFLLAFEFSAYTTQFHLYWIKILSLNVIYPTCDGITGVKKLFSRKILLPPTAYVAVTRDSGICISFTLYKSYRLNFRFGGHLESQGSKGHFHQSVSPPTDCTALSCDSCICMSLTTSTKV